MSVFKQMLSRFSFDSLWKLVDLRNRLLFTLLMLFVYRIGTRVPIPGVNFAIMDNGINFNSSYLNTMNTLAGGALSNASIMALGIMPFITASIMINLLSNTSDDWIALKKEGESGRAKIEEYTRYLALCLSVVYGSGTLWLLESSNVVLNPGIIFRITGLLSISSSVMFLIWISDQITKIGIGQGPSIILSAGILSGLVSFLIMMFEVSRLGAISFIALGGFIIFFTLALVFIVFIESAQRKIPIIYAKRQLAFGNVNEQMYIPIKANVADITPIIFTSIIMSMPTNIIALIERLVKYFQLEEYISFAWLNYIPSYTYYVASIGLIFFVAIAYAPIVWPPEDHAERINKENGFIPGYHPGAKTAEFFTYLLLKMSIISGCYLSIMFVAPDLINGAFFTPLSFYGTTLVIVVNTIINTMAQISGYIISMQYQVMQKASEKMQSKMRRIIGKRK
jgi:preprotein translocase subunit SecY